MSKITVPGFNPIRHCCRTEGCYLDCNHIPIEFFAGALPGKISMSDIDAVAEVNGHFLFLEGKKGAPSDLPTGQRILAQRLTGISSNIIYVAVWFQDDPRDISHICPVFEGKIGKIEPLDFQGLYDRIHRWASRVKLRAIDDPPPPSDAPAEQVRAA